MMQHSEQDNTKPSAGGTYAIMYELGIKLVAGPPAKKQLLKRPKIRQTVSFIMKNTARVLGAAKKQLLERPKTPPISVSCRMKNAAGVLGANQRMKPTRC